MVQIGLDDDYADYYADNIKGEHEPFPPSLEKEWYGLSQEDRYLLVSEWISEEVKSYGEMRVG